MAKEKKLTKAERKEARLQKGKQWLLTYTGSPKKMRWFGLLEGTLFQKVALMFQCVQIISECCQVRYL